MAVTTSKPAVIRVLENEINNDDRLTVARLGTWLNLSMLLPIFEDLLLDAPRDEDELRKFHRQLLEFLIVSGDQLTSHHDFEKSLELLGWTASNFKSKIDMLRYDTRLWHTDVSEDKAEAILNSIFE